MSVGFAALAKRAATSQSPARVTPRSPDSASEKKAGSQREVGQVRKPPLTARLSLSCRVPEGETGQRPHRSLARDRHAVPDGVPERD